MEQEPINLGKELTAWRKGLAARGITPEVIEELETHLTDSVDTLQASGLSAAEAFRVAVERLGDPGDLTTTAGTPPPDGTRKARGGCARPLGVFFLIGGLLLVIAAVAIPIVFSMLPKKYVAASTVQVRAGKQPGPLRTEIEMIQSRKVLEQVVTDLELAREWNLTTEEAYTVLSTLLRINPIHQTDLLKIEIRDSDPHRAAKLANRIVQTYVALRASSVEQGAASPPTRPAVIHELAVANETPTGPRQTWIMTCAAMLGAAGFGVLIIGIVVLILSRKHPA